MKDLQSGGLALVSNQYVTGNGGSLLDRTRSVSADGRYVAFQSFASNLVPGDTNNTWDIFVKDTQTNAISRVSTSSGNGEANDISYNPSISADGRYIAFYSRANNLISNDTNNASDIFVKDVQTGTITRVSTNSSSGEANGQSFDPSISADGRYVAFLSSANNLVSNDTNNAIDIFVKDTQTNAISRVSTSSSSGEANNPSNYPSISADGRYVAFQSDANNLVPGDTNNAGDIFVKDTQTNAISRVSTSSGNGEANSQSRYPSISEDGRYVAFSSLANNFVPGDSNNGFDVFLKDLQTSDLGLVSSKLLLTSNTGNGTSIAPQASADGRFVVYQSSSTNLVPGDFNNKTDIFVTDMQTKTVTRVNTSSTEVEANGNASAPAISDDGRYVVFYSDASNLVPGDSNGLFDVFRKDRQTGAIIRVSVPNGGGEANGNSSDPSISADGRYVAFHSTASNLVAGDTNGVSDIFVYDTQTGTLVRASQDTVFGEGNSSSFAASLSSDGRYVTFQSSASNLVSGDVNGAEDIFVKDLQTGAIALASLSSSNVQGNASSSTPKISANGRFVVFKSAASNLVTPDTNGAVDIFVKDMVTGAIYRANQDSAGTQGSTDAFHPSISADGRYALFATDSGNLVANDTNGQTDVFVKDIQTGALTRVNLNSLGQQGNGPAALPTMSANGQFVFFSTLANNLDALDNNSASDVFRVSFAGGPAGSISATLTRNSLVLSDTDVTGKNNQFTIKKDSSGNLVISDANEQFAGAPAGWTLAPDGKSISILASSFTGTVTINGAGGNDTFTRDYSNGDPLNGRNLFINGGSGGLDTLVIQNGSFATADYNFTNSNDGSVVLDPDGAGAAPPSTTVYTGLDPISSSINATNVTLNYSTTAETITITSAGAGTTSVASTAGETVTFTNPTANLVINAGAVGADIITLSSLGSGFAANLTIDGQGGGDTANINGAVNIGAGNLAVTAGVINSNATFTTTGNAILTATGGAIVDGNGTSVNIVAATLIATATAGINLDTTVATLEASGGSGGVNIDETDALIIGPIAGSSIVGVSATGGNISIDANGDVTVNEAVNNSGTGNTSIVAGLQGAPAGPTPIVEYLFEGNALDTSGNSQNGTLLPIAFLTSVRTLVPLGS